VLVRENSAAEAEASARNVLDRNFWELPEVKQAAPLNPKLGVSQVAEDAITDAASHGVSLIVYDDPILPH